MRRYLLVIYNQKDEPRSKKMADNQILEAINGIKASVKSMEKQLKAAPTKEDIGSIVTELRGVKETVIRNTDRIDTLFDLRKEDAVLLTKKVEKIVEAKLPAAGQQTRAPIEAENEREFLLCRRSVRLWPVQDSGGLEKGVKKFLAYYLKMPAEVVESLTFVEVEKQGQTRRSKIKDEVLIRLQTSQQRDMIQSYAPNLASAQGLAGIRRDIPVHLGGLFRLFESHAAALRAQYGTVKRAVRFDDVEKSLYMDIKLQDTDWHRVSASEIREAETQRKKRAKQTSKSGAAAADEKRKILMMSTEQPPEVESDADSESNI